MYNLIIILLAVIAASEVARLFMTHWPTSKRRHFKQKLDGVRKMMWDLEFKVYKTREIREDIRQEYDFMQSRIDSLNKQKESFPKEGDQAERARLDDQIALATRDRDRLLAQIKMLDAEVEGSKPTEENRAGTEGIVQQIDSLRELTEMLRGWIKSL